MSRNNTSAATACSGVIIFASRLSSPALEIQAYLHQRNEGVATFLGKCITDKVFLERQLPNLHADALYALATMQQPNQSPEREIFHGWLKPFDSELPELRYRFIVPAFVGIAFASPNVPTRELIELLRITDVAEKENVKYTIAPAILSLYKRRPNGQKVQKEIWDAIKGENVEQFWNRIGQSINHTSCKLPPFADAAQKYSS